MSQPTSTPVGPGPLRRAEKRLRAARAAGEEFEALVDHLAEYPYPAFEHTEWIVTSCSRLARHAARLIEALRSCGHLPWGPRRIRLLEEAEAWAVGVTDALRRAVNLAGSIHEENEEDDNVDWLADLHSDGCDALRRVARLEAFLAEP